MLQLTLTGKITHSESLTKLHRVRSISGSGVTYISEFDEFEGIWMLAAGDQHSSSLRRQGCIRTIRNCNAAKSFGMDARVALKVHAQIQMLPGGRVCSLQEYELSINPTDRSGQHAEAGRKLQRGIASMYAAANRHLGQSWYACLLGKRYYSL